MEKIDYKTELKQLYQASSKEVVQVEVPPLNYLMVDGQGDPNTAQSYKDAVEALFSVSYTLKFMVKKGPTALDYAVMPLEGLWWADDIAHFGTGDKSQWKWTARVMQPPFIRAQGALRGKHHEIYLSDIRRTVPEKWKTIIRQPMQ